MRIRDLTRREFLKQTAELSAAGGLFAMLARQQTSAAELPKAGPADWPRYGGLPAYVSAGAGEAPWAALWELRDIGGSRLAAWFRELASQGYTGPPESRDWLPRTPTNHEGAKRLAKARLRQIAAWCGGWPPFLLNDRPGRPARPSHSLRPVARVFPDGRVERFVSTWAAARAGWCPARTPGSGWSRRCARGAWPGGTARR